MKKNKKIIITIISIIIVAIPVILYLFFNNKKTPDGEIKVLSTSGKEYKNGLVTIGANEKIQLIISTQNNKDKVINYGAFYKMLEDNVNKSAFQIYATNNDENKYDDIEGSTEKKEITMLLEAINSTNKDITIKLGIKISELAITYEKDQLAISEKKENIANAPVLADGMIPIYYDEASKNWKKANENNNNNNWYNYNVGKWANIALVTENTRDNYQNVLEGTSIKENDILAYFVWIPRYKYQLFNTEFLASNSTPINIEFETTNIPKNNGKKNGEWLTHPAFTFGEKELAGIWVGKFETTGNSINPTVKPNLLSLTNQIISEQFLTAQNFMSKTYFDNNAIEKIDTHMAKNIEWGAVAYLSNSIFGRCKNDRCEDIKNNNISTTSDTNGNAITGCSAIQNDNKIVINKTCDTEFTKPYDNISYGVLASTTGSIYGIYDMSGGSWEQVMGVLISKDGQSITTGYDSNFNSGFSGEFCYDKNHIGINLPNKKYYDLYGYNLEEFQYSYSHLGDATGETRGWNSDYQEFITDDYPWFMRGGLYLHRKQDGMFAFGSTGGGRAITKGFRTILVNIK